MMARATRAKAYMCPPQRKPAPVFRRAAREQIVREDLPLKERHDAEIVPARGRWHTGGARKCTPHKAGTAADEYADIAQGCIWFERKTQQCRKGLLEKGGYAEVSTGFGDKTLTRGRIKAGKTEYSVGIR